MSLKDISLDCLPFELIEHILKFNVVSFKDICRLACVSPLFNCIGKSNKLWLTKFIQEYPILASKYNAINTDWKSEFCLIFGFKKKIINGLDVLATNCYFHDNISSESFVELLNACENHQFAKIILLNELMGIIDDKNRHTNLTLKFYAQKALRYIKHSVLEDIWKNYTLFKYEKFSVLKGACFVADWHHINETDCTKNVYMEFNQIIERVFYKLKQDFPQHPLLANSLPVLNKVNDVLIKDSLWSLSDCKKVILCIDSILFESLKYTVENAVSSTDNIHIHKVFLTCHGVTTSLGVMIHTIASKFGVLCLLTESASHLKVVSKDYKGISTPNTSFTYNISDRGKPLILTELELQSASVKDFKPIPLFKIFSTLCWNIIEFSRSADNDYDGLEPICDSLELINVLTPHEREHKIFLARVYLNMHVNMAQVTKLLQELSVQDPISAGMLGLMHRSAISFLEHRRNQELNLEDPHLRNENNSHVKFAIGMIMKHKKYKYRCVIYGWDTVCLASTEWQDRMGVHNLPFKDKQPFYNVLVEDYSNRYAAEENLEVDEKHLPVGHPEVGRYFDSFHGDYYKPNRFKLVEYPEDSAVRHNILNCVCEHTV